MPFLTGWHQLLFYSTGNLVTRKYYSEDICTWYSRVRNILKCLVYVIFQLLIDQIFWLRYEESVIYSFVFLCLDVIWVNHESMININIFVFTRNVCSSVYLFYRVFLLWLKKAKFFFFMFSKTKQEIKIVAKWK